MKGFIATLAGSRRPNIYGAGNCSREEWEGLLVHEINCRLQDEQEHGRRFDWAELCHLFPQLTLREFVAACSRARLPEPE